MNVPYLKMYNFSFLEVYSTVKLFIQFKCSLVYLIHVFKLKSVGFEWVDDSFNIIQL